MMIKQLFNMPFLKLEKIEYSDATIRILRQLNLGSQGALIVEDKAKEYMIIISEPYLIFRYFRTKRLSF